MIVLVDEAEAHLHPKWQRVILPALLGISSDLNQELSVQWVIASHSPARDGFREKRYGTPTQILSSISK